MENLRRDEREARRLSGETPLHRGRKKRSFKPTDSDYFEKMNKETFETNPQRIYSMGRADNWYVFGFTLEGRKAVYGPKGTEAEALEAGRKLDQLETFNLGTRNLAAATQIIKGKLLARGEDPDSALKRTKHTEETKSHSIFRRK